VAEGAEAVGSTINTNASISGAVSGAGGLEAPPPTGEGGSGAAAAAAAAAGGGINLGALSPSLMQQIAAVAAAAGGATGPTAAPLPNLFDASKPSFNLLDILVSVHVLCVAYG